MKIPHPTGYIFADVHLFDYIEICKARRRIIIGNFYLVKSPGEFLQVVPEIEMTLFQVNLTWFEFSIRDVLEFEFPIRDVSGRRDVYILRPWWI